MAMIIFSENLISWQPCNQVIRVKFILNPLYHFYLRSMCDFGQFQFHYSLRKKHTQSGNTLAVYNWTLFQYLTQYFRIG